MGWAIPIAALAAGGAGAGMQMSAASSEKDAMTKAVNEELMRQRGYGGKAMQAVNKNIGQNTPESTTANQNKGAQEAMALYKQNMLPATATASMGTPASLYIPSNADTAKQSQSNEAASQLQGQSNIGLQQRIGNLQTQSALGQQIGNAQRSEAVLPTELNAAQHSQDSLAMAGQVVSWLGSLASVLGPGWLGALGAGAGAAGAGAGTGDLYNFQQAIPNNPYYGSH